jgi:hypothetical protein
MNRHLTTVGVVAAVLVLTALLFAVVDLNTAYADSNQVKINQHTKTGNNDACSANINACFIGSAG